MPSINSLSNAEKLLYGILVLGLGGLLFIVVFANFLTINLGFPQNTYRFNNESGYLNSSGYQLLQISGNPYVESLVIESVLNGESMNETIPSTNYELIQDVGNGVYLLNATCV